MDSINSKTSNLIDKYIKGKLSGTTLRDFEQITMKNAAIAKEIKFRKNIVQEFHRQDEVLQFKSLLKKIEHETPEEANQTTLRKQNKTEPDAPAEVRQLNSGSRIYRHVSAAAIALLFISSSLLGYGFVQKNEEVAKLSAIKIENIELSHNISLIKKEKENLQEQRNKFEQKIALLENNFTDNKRRSGQLESKLFSYESNIKTLEEDTKILQNNINQLELSNKNLVLEKEQLAIQLQQYKDDNYNPDLITLANNYLNLEINEAHFSTGKTRSLQVNPNTNNTAVQYFKEKNYPRSLEYFIANSKKTIDLPDPISAHYIGLCYLAPSINQVDKAIENLEFVKQQEASLINDTRWYLALAYLKMNKPEIAKNNLYEIIIDLEKNPEDKIRMDALKLIAEIR